MTDFQIKQMNNNLKDISMQLRNINRTLVAICRKLESNGFAVLPTVETTLTTLEEKEEN